MIKCSTCTTKFSSTPLWQLHDLDGGPTPCRGVRGRRATGPPSASYASPYPPKWLSHSHATTTSTRRRTRRRSASGPRRMGRPLRNSTYSVWCGGCSTLRPDQDGHGLLLLMLLLLRGTRCRRCCCCRRWRMLLARLRRSWQLRSWQLLRIWRLCIWQPTRRRQ